MAANIYETVFIAEPEISTEQVDQLITRLKEAITAARGTVTGEDRWGRRRLAYPIQGHREGFYTVLNYSAEPTVVAAVEHLFNVTDSVVRHLTIRVIKKTKKFAPRRERPAGAAEGHRPSGRSGGPPRSRSESSPRPPDRQAGPSSGSPAPAAATAAAEPSPAPVPAPSTPEGGPQS